MASFGVDNKKEYDRALNEYWLRVDESEGFDIEGIIGPRGNLFSGQMISFDCEGLNSRNYPLGWKVKCYGKLGLHRYNLIQGTNFELDSLFKFNKQGSGASSFFITLAAVDAFSAPWMQTFQVRVDEQQCACLNVVCSVARISGDTSARAQTLTDSSLRGALPDWPSNVDIQRFYMVDQSELLSSHWIRLYLELLLCIEYGQPLEGNFSSLEFVEVAIETDEESPLKAKSSVLYITFKGLAVDGADESVEQRAIIKSLFNELTGCLAVKGELWKGENYVAPMSLFERRLAYRLSRGRA